MAPGACDAGPPDRYCDSTPRPEPGAGDVVVLGAEGPHSRAAVNTATAPPWLPWPPTSADHHHPYHPGTHGPHGANVGRSAARAPPQICGGPTDLGSVQEAGHPQRPLERVPERRRFPGAYFSRPRCAGGARTAASAPGPARPVVASCRAGTAGTRSGAGGAGSRAASTGHIPPSYRSGLHSP